MRRRRVHEETSGGGEDAFLDTTANLVGILIILVVVIGTKTKIDAEEHGRKLAAEAVDTSLDEPQREATALAESLGHQEEEFEEYQLETQYRKRERNALLVKVATARDLVDRVAATADDSTIAAAEQNKRRTELESNLQNIDSQLEQSENAERPKIILEHLPTPMAKTVFTREMHVQLKAGKLTVIPWDRLVGLLKEQVPLAVRRKSSQRNIEDTLGPVGGILMRYRMNAIPGGYELERFELELVAGAHAESLQQALSPSGRLRLELAGRDPAETVVTAWVYPDSFEQFRQLKATLFEEGYLSAARPLPNGVRIGASPHGTRSSAQ